MKQKCLKTLMALGILLLVCAALVEPHQSVETQLKRLNPPRVYLIWDNDGGHTFEDPNDAFGTQRYCTMGSRELTSPEKELEEALRLADSEAIIIVTPQDAPLDTYDLYMYDMVFAVLGWSDTSGAAGHIEEAEQESLMAYLDSGGALYLEGNDLFEDAAHDSLFLETYLGGRLEVPAVDVDSVIGEDWTFLDGFAFFYDGRGPRSSIDGIEPTAGMAIVRSKSNVVDEDIYHKEGDHCEPEQVVPRGIPLGRGEESGGGKIIGICSSNYRAVSFSFVPGAMEESEGNTLCAFLGEILEYLEVFGTIIQLQLEQETGGGGGLRGDGGYPGQPLYFSYHIKNVEDTPFTGYLHLLLRDEAANSNFYHYFEALACSLGAYDRIDSVRYELIPETIPPGSYQFCGHVSENIEDTTGPWKYHDHFPVKILPPTGCLIVPDETHIVIPPGGGSFGFTATIFNRMDTEEVTVNMWTDALKPDGEVSETLLGPWEYEIPPHESVSQHLTQYIAASFPPGTYCYCLNGGIYREPDTTNILWDQDCIEFMKKH